MRGFCLTLLLCGCCLISPAAAGWKVLPPHDSRTELPKSIPGDAKAIKKGDELPDDNKFRWLIGDLSIPESINGQSTKGQPVGLRLACGDGGEAYLNGKFKVRFDNDTPALLVVSKSAQPGEAVRVEALVYGKVQGSGKFDEASWVIIDAPRARERRLITVNPAKTTGPVPDGLVGLSQGGGLADYEDATAEKLREGGFKWFRMDNIMTNTMKKNDKGEIVYDWTDFDRRVDFMHKMGAAPILAVSYMPQVLDAIEDHERHSAPKSYEVWEELCFQAAKRCVDRKVRVAYWEVWNEVNTGWLKPGPEDTGSERFQKLYDEALGKHQPEKDVIRRFEAYCKLYKATAKGVLRADPKALVGGPALASGPFENDELAHCFHGRGFSRGLMAYCTEEKLPLNFLSWHEYFQSWQTVDKEAKAFKSYLEDYPTIKPQVKSLFITEWNEAWWSNRPHDHELGASWCADSLVRACIPNGDVKPCFFFVKQNDDIFQGHWAMIMKDNVPKASYNVLKMFNHLSGQWIEFTGTDDDVCGVASWDAEKKQLKVILVNYRDRYGVPRDVQLKIPGLPKELLNGQFKEHLVDGTHSNVWHDRKTAELQQVNQGAIQGDSFVIDRTLEPNSVTLFELTPAAKE
ncbi:MAG: hypothetical protein SGJ20_11795 [Planctomycetota bacterium]|nr:hypothetical protein [Planctomycetota bacterium]